MSLVNAQWERGDGAIDTLGQDIGFPVAGLRAVVCYMPGWFLASSTAWLASLLWRSVLALLSHELPNSMFVTSPSGGNGVDPRVPRAGGETISIFLVALQGALFSRPQPRDCMQLHNAKWRPVLALLLLLACLTGW